jgi:hypothetical protein
MKEATIHTMTCTFVFMYVCKGCAKIRPALALRTPKTIVLYIFMSLYSFETL